MAADIPKSQSVLNEQSENLAAQVCERRVTDVNRASLVTSMKLVAPCLEGGRYKRENRVKNTCHIGRAARRLQGGRWEKVSVGQL